MKLTEWLITISMVIIGVSCLTMSATSIMDPSSIHPYLYNFLRICMWIGIPALITGVLYLMLKKRKETRNEQNDE